MRVLVLYLFLLKLKVRFNSNPGYINKSLRVTKICLEKILKRNIWQKFYLTLIFVLVPIEADLLKKKKAANKI